jgi:MoaA/NifB/PqqE/SkfB family radical SAM enzyme
VTPKIVHVEVTTACNLRCVHCAIRTPEYRHLVMSREIFERILPALSRWRPHVILNGHGEALTHPDYPWMFEQVARAGSPIEFQTNTLALSRELVDRFLLTGRWERLTVSIDGTGAVYEQIRGIPWAGTLTRLKAFAAARGNRPRPALGIEFVAMRRNIAELPAVARLAAELRAERLLVTDLIEYQGTAGEGLVREPETLRPHLEAAREICRAGQVYLEVSAAVSTALGWSNLRFGGHFSHCAIPPAVAFIRPNGDVFPCCWLAWLIDPLGNLADSSLEEICAGGKWHDFLAAMKAGTAPQRCQVCTRLEMEK